MNFSKIVVSRLFELQMTRIELAEKTGISTSYIAQLLKGKKRWNEDTIVKICNVLKLEIKFVEKTV